MQTRSCRQCFRRAIPLLIACSLTGFTAFGQGIQMTVEYQTARQQLAQSNYDAAISALQPLLARPETAAAAQVELGNIRLRQAEGEMSAALGHFSDAATYLSMGIEQGGLKGVEVPKILYDLGRIYEERLNDYKKAADVYARIAQNHTTFLSIDKVTYHLALCCEKLGRLEEAATYYREIVGKYPYSSFFQISQNRMKALAPGTSQAGAAIETQENLVEGARSEAQAAKANMDLGAMHVKNGNFKAAADAYRLAANEAPNPEMARQAYQKLASLLDEKQKDYKGAAAALEEMITKFPDDPGNADSYHRLGKIYENDIDDMKTRIVDGQVRYRKDTEGTMKAIEYYDKLTERFPDADGTADAFIRKGELYLKELKEPDEAKKQYKEFLQRFPDHAEADNVRERLKKIEEDY